MFRRRNQSALYRVIVEIVQLLLHHLVIGYFLRMRSFLPHLMHAFHLVLRTEILELIQEPLHIFRFQ